MLKQCPVHPKIETERKQMIGFLFYITIVVLIQKDDAFPTGAPDVTCWTLYPHHNVFTQTSQCPFTLTFTPFPFHPAQEVTIDIAGPNNRTFKGIELGAHRSVGNPEVYIGQFVEFPRDKIQTFNCFSGSQNIITHTNNNPVSSLRVKWRAPSEYVGNVTFKGTIVVDYYTFWVGFEHILEAAASTVPPAPMSYPEISVASANIKNIDFSACGDTKGCFMYPRYCTGDNCLAAATYQYRDGTKDYQIELFTSKGPHYVALGLSDDRLMGNDATLVCASNEGYMSMQQGWNPSDYNDRQFTRDISHIEVKKSDGNILCRFILPEVLPVYHVNQTSSSFQYATQDYDTNQEWYLLMAWGEVGTGSDAIEHHEDMPVISFSKVGMKNKAVVHGSAFHIFIRVHGAMMVIAWVLFAGIVTVVSRHYREWLPSKRLFGTKVWFQVHRGFAILVGTFTAIGLIVIFVHFGSEIRIEAIPHAYVGLTVVGCVGMQIIAGCLRPGLDHKIRPIFNWAHFLLGQASHILAATTMFLAFDIDYITSTMRKFGFIVLSIWLCCQMLWHVIYECVSRRGGRGDKKVESCNMDTGALECTEDSKPSSLKTWMLVSYIGCLMIICTAVLSAFLLF